MQGNRLMLVIAIAAGVLATVLAFTYISNATSAMEPQLAERKVDVLFVVNDLPANHLLDPDVDLRKEQVGVETSPGLARGAIPAEEKDALRGQRIGAPLPAGVPLMYANLAQVSDLELAPGSRAMSIQVDATGTMGGILVPGDHVDIMVSYPRPPEPSAQPAAAPSFDAADPQAMLGAVFAQAMQSAANPDEWETRLVLTNVRVIAIGQQMGASRQQFLFGPESGLTGTGGSIITIEVTPPQAVDLLKMTAGGSNPITLLLRPPVLAPAAGEGGLLQEG